MQEVIDFLKKAGAYFLATADGDQPRVRAFGTAHVFEDKLYIQTGKSKAVAQQILANPKIEMYAMVERNTIRITALALEDDRAEAQQSMLDAYPSLAGRYNVGDGNMVVFYLKDATATISEGPGEPKVIKF